MPRMAAIFVSGTALARAASLLAAAALVTACVTLTHEPRALLERDDGTIEVQTLACGPRIANELRASRMSAEGPPRGANSASSVGSAAATAASVGGTQTTAQKGLDPDALRIVSWNIHKQGDAGWQRDLRSLGAASDVVLLQETVLDAQLRQLIADAGLRWVMASSFLHADVDIGVLTAARVAPLAACTQRVVEPLLRLPKSSVITWFALRDRADTLAVVNVHAINFSLSLGAYRAQFDAIGDALAAHTGPLILAGDLNTWTVARAQVVREVATRLGLAEVPFAADRRSVFFGHQLDHIYVRGLALVASSATEVTSSDHNPVAATLRDAR
jgi:endonuclease/exonuclease/phosphatase (EEP) superfamily protein YafD